MAWNEVLVDRLRLVINDLEDTPVWTDEQLEKFVVLSAIQVSDKLQKWNIQSYTFDTAAPNISPDPITSDSQAFNNLIVLKAAMIITNAEIKKTSASAGFKITDDKSTIDTTAVLSNLKGILENYSNLYQEAMNDYKEGNQFAGEAILSPYASSEGSPIIMPLYGSYNRWQ